MCTKTDRRFSYYLFENYYAADAADNSLNPRRFLNASTDGLISWIADTPEQKRNYASASARFGAENVDRIVVGGIVRREQETLFFDTPVFLAEDAMPLQTFFSDVASGLAAKLSERKATFYELAEELKNGFSPKINLYHILCGMCFDGMFLEKLGKSGVIADSKAHASGLDYLAVVYEKCPELNRFSDGLLCSYNSISDGTIALQSFGDGNGTRLDCYRYFRLRELGKLTDRFSEVDYLLTDYTETDLLKTIKALLVGKTTPPKLAVALDRFGYAKGGQICVPVYLPEHREIIREIEVFLEETLFAQIVDVLSDMSKLRITASNHNVPQKELANECWHILFGSINEALVRTGLVAAPPFRPGEGRYLQSIELEIGK